jgi:hypothetical protein
MVHDFARIEGENIPRSSFSLSHSHKTTMDGGPLVPFFLQEVVPGDSHSVTANVFARLATPINPIMDSLKVETFFFFVPNRLVWDNWVKFMGEQDNPGDSTDFTVPTLTPGQIYLNESIEDYFGLPTQVVLTDVDICALPFRGYNLIWNQWFRSEDLQNSLPVATDDGPDPTTNVLQNRGKRHDYFTSCLPWPQKGPGVDLPLGTEARIRGLGVRPTASWSNTNESVNESYPFTETYVDNIKRS